MKLKFNFDLKSIPDTFTKLTNIKLEKDFYKKPKFLLVVGAILIFFGFIIYSTRPQQTYTETGEVELERLSDEQARTVIESLLKNAIEVYENPSSLFKTSDAKVEVAKDKEEEKKEDKKEESKEEKKEEETNNAKLISNYDEIIKTIYTEKGIKQLEKMTFKDKSYVHKEDDKVYFMNNVIDEEYSLTDIAFTYSNFVINKDKISANINFNKVTIDEINAVNYYIITKPIKLVKSGDNWLIDSFEYTNG